jgi:hypothetical protein
MLAVSGYKLEASVRIIVCEVAIKTSDRTSLVLDDVVAAACTSHFLIVFEAARSPCGRRGCFSGTELVQGTAWRLQSVEQYKIGRSLMDTASYFIGGEPSDHVLMIVS